MLTVQRIVDLTNSSIAAGSPDLVITGISSFDDAGPEDLTFAVDQTFLSRLDQTRAGAILVPDSFSPDKTYQTALLKSEIPKISFFKVLMFCNSIIFNKIIFGMQLA